ncbi:hypothetical protein DFS34DRAFT_235434 [Phlyctochytrium arcticum]|nr:hypothetical protein DFS34DRAFT_235434 [Phlyctochytrium arcticum]
MAQLLTHHSPVDVTELFLDNQKIPAILNLQDAPTPLSEYQRLTHLSLNNCGLSSLEGFPYLPSLQKLDLGDNRISGDLASLSILPSLQSVDLSNNRVADLDALRPLSGIRSLQHLNLFQCDVSRTSGYPNTVFSLIPTLLSVDDRDRNGNEVDTYSEDEEDEDDDEDAAGESGDAGKYRSRIAGPELPSEDLDTDQTGGADSDFDDEDFFGDEDDVIDVDAQASPATVVHLVDEEGDDEDAEGEDEEDENEDIDLDAEGEDEEEQLEQFEGDDEGEGEQEEDEDDGAVDNPAASNEIEDDERSGSQIDDEDQDEGGDDEDDEQGAEDDDEVDDEEDEADEVEEVDDGDDAYAYQNHGDKGLPSSTIYPTTIDFDPTMGLDPTMDVSDFAGDYGADFAGGLDTDLSYLTEQGSVAYPTNPFGDPSNYADPTSLSDPSALAPDFGDDSLVGLDSDLSSFLPGHKRKRDVDDTDVDVDVQNIVAEAELEIAGILGVGGEPQHLEDFVTDWDEAK